MASSKASLSSSSDRNCAWIFSGMATQRLRRRKHKLNQLRIMRAALLALCPTVDRKVELLKKEAAESNAETT